MKAWQVQQLGDPEQALRLEEVEEPEPGRGEVVVEVCEGLGAEVAIEVLIGRRTSSRSSRRRRRAAAPT